MTMVAVVIMATMVMMAKVIPEIMAMRDNSNDGEDVACHETSKLGQLEWVP